MNSKWIQGLIILFAFILLTGCSGNSSDANNNGKALTNKTGGTEEVAEDAIRLTVSLYKGQQFINETEREHQADKSLLRIMQENFFVEEEDGVILSIERVHAKEDEEWVFYIDDEKSDLKPEDYEPQPGDKIQFDLQSTEDD